MNTRSSTASRRRHMTVDFSSEHAENTSYLAGCRSAVDDNINVDNSSVEINVNKNQHEHDFCNIYEEETSIRSRNADQSFDEKDDFSVSSGVTTRSSSRPGKRKRAISPQRSLNTTPESSKLDGKRLKSGHKPQKRQWESWGPKEKDVFFEAVLEHSKDFDKIHSYLMKRRGDLSSIVKNKDQVRHFYYRTLNKISKYIPEQHDPLESKKTNYEVRCLICYGELRKKFRSLKEKDGKKLTELIATGKTTVRHQGRNVNIRAPVCRVLKKLSSNIVIDEVEHVPSKIMIELVPSDNKTWSVIQGLAQNPRLRTTVSSRKTLYSLLMYLSSKWKLRNNVSITLSPSLVKGHRKAVLNKRNDNENVGKSKQSCEEKIVDDNCVDEEQCSPDDAATRPFSSITSTDPSKIDEFERTVDSKEREKHDSFREGNDHVLPEKGDVSEEKDDATLEKDDIQSGREEVSPDKNGVVPDTENIQSAKDSIQREKDTVSGTVEQQKWDLSNCSNITITDVYRKLGCPSKLALCYCLSLNDHGNELLTINALEHLVKLAMGEFREKIDAKNGSKKDSSNPPSSSSKAKLVAKDSVTVSKPSKVSKPSSKTTTKLAPKLAPKLVREPSLVIPAIVPSVINQISPSVPTRTGNHVTFGFTPISSFQTPSPFIPKTKKNRKSRVVVQRTLLPRPSTGPLSGATNKASSPTTSESSSPQRTAASPQQSSKQINTFSKSIRQDSEGHLPSSSQDAGSGFSVESLLKVALGQELADNVDKLLSSKSVSRYDGAVCTEELDSGISGGATSVKTRSKEARSLVEEIENLHSHEHYVEHSNELLDNLKSSEDEDPLKLLSPPHTQHFHPEWLSEESSDFSLSNIFEKYMDHSPTKQKHTNVLDTPKKGTADFKFTESHEKEDIPRYLQTEPAFCDMVDESSVDYVKKFRDLAKKMKNDSESVSPPNTSSAVSFKSLLSEASVKLKD